MKPKDGSQNTHGSEILKIYRILNKKAAFAKLISTEKRLAKNSEHAKVYKEQILDMVNRGVARKLTKAELTNYKGPIHYISHHEVLKPDSKSTPVRIVFNSSAKYMGHVLNEYWVILNNTYMDDIIESVNNRKKAKQITDDIEKLLDKGGFKLKEMDLLGRSIEHT